MPASAPGPRAAGLAVVLVPITLGVGVLTESLLRYHSTVYALGGLLMLALAAVVILGLHWSLPMLRGAPDLQRTDAGGVFGVAGALFGHSLKYVTSEQFNIEISVIYLAMIIIGGLGSIIGSVFGAVFMILLPNLLSAGTEIVAADLASIARLAIELEHGIFGLIIILFLIFEPDGLAHRGKMVKAYWKLYPFSY